MAGSRQRLNKIVRTFPGGNETLDAIELFQKIAQRKHPDTESGQIAKLAVDHLDAIANKMRDAALQLEKEDRK